jgi:hypothetical protein
MIRFLHEEVIDRIRDMADHLVDFLCLPPCYVRSSDNPTTWFATQKVLLFNSVLEEIPFAKSVLALARRYDVSPDDELASQVACKVGEGPGNNILKVGTVWILACIGMLIFLSDIMPPHLMLCLLGISNNFF